MKLSEVQGDAALDLLADILEPVGEIMGDKEVAAAAKGQNKMKAVSVAIKGHKKAVIEILARLDGVDPKEYKVNVLTLPVKLLELLNDKELVQLFTWQGQTGDATSSGSVSENTEDKKQ